MGAYRLEVALGLLVFGLGAYFYTGYGWNQTARYDAIWNFVEPGPDQHTFRIDRFVVGPDAENTGDWARNPELGPHYYSNKAPGTVLLGVPFYYAVYGGERLAGLDPLSVEGVLVNAYLINLWVTVLPVAVSAAFFFHLALVLTARRRRALLLTLVLYTGTLMLPFSTAMWGHTTAAAFVVMALAMYVRPTRKGMFWTGVFLGLAALTDYGALPLVLLVLVWTVASPRRRGHIGALALGGFGPALLFGAYHQLLFGSFLTLASSHSNPTMIDGEHVAGLLTLPSLRAMWHLSFSSHRGVFFHMPVLVLGFISAGRVRRSEHREFASMLLTGIALIFLLNSSFNGWWGGAATGPRYQIIVLPFYVALLALLPAGPWVRRALLTLAVVSASNMFVTASVSSMAPDALRGSPLLFCYRQLSRAPLVGEGPEDLSGPAAPISRGSLHLYPNFPMRSWDMELRDPLHTTYSSFNLGERVLGLRGLVSLLPALLGFLALAGAMTRWVHAPDAAHLRRSKT